MKRFVIALFVMFLAVPLWAAEAPVTVKPCPKTLMVRECLTCHVAPSFAIKESAPDARLVYPFSGMKIIAEGNIPVGYYLMTNINSDEVKSFLDYLDRRDIKKAIIEIHSPGGPLFEGQRIVGLIRSFQARGGHVTTKVNGMAFSAGFIVFTVGDFRVVDEYAALMWHEIQSGGFGFNVKSTSDTENDAKTLRGLQNVLHTYLATRGKLSKDEIDQKVNKRQEWWMSGADAVSFGFADAFVNKGK